MSTELFPGRLGELLICKVSGKTGWLNWRSKDFPKGILEKMSHNTLKKVWEEQDYSRSKEVKISTQEKPYKGACSAGQAVHLGG